MWTSIRMAPWSKPEGLVIPCLAISGAEPCMASNIACMASNIAKLSSILAEPAMPTEPAISAVTSETMSPYTFGVTMTANVSGAVESCVQADDYVDPVDQADGILAAHLRLDSGGGDEQGVPGLTEHFQNGTAC